MRVIDSYAGCPFYSVMSDSAKSANSADVAKKAQTDINGATLASQTWVSGRLNSKLDASAIIDGNSIINKTDTASTVGWCSIANGITAKADSKSLANGFFPSADTYSLANGDRVSANSGSLADGTTAIASGYSLAVGNTVSAKSASMALGSACSATSGSVSIGINNSANREAVAIGFGNVGDFKSFVHGGLNSASNLSFAQGEVNSADHRGFVQGTRNSAYDASVAIGQGNSAERQSITIGEYNSAAYASITVGNYNYAKNQSLSIGGGSNSASYNSLALGGGVRAFNQSLAVGGDTVASSDSFAQGGGIYASAQSLAQGGGVTAKDYSLAQGSSCSAYSGSIAQGGKTSASNFSQAFGLNNIMTDNGMAIGQYNKTSANAAFVIGNGTSSTRSDLFTIDKNGNVSSNDFTAYNGNKLSECTTSVYVITPTTTQNEIVSNSDKALFFKDESDNTYPLTNKTVKTGYTAYEFRGFNGSNNEIQTYITNVYPNSDDPVTVVGNKNNYLNVGYDDSSEQPVKIIYDYTSNLYNGTATMNIIVEAQNEYIYICAWPYAWWNGDYSNFDTNYTIKINNSNHSDWVFDEDKGYYYIKYKVNTSATITITESNTYPLFFVSETYGQLTENYWYDGVSVLNHQSTTFIKNKLAKYNVEILDNVAASIKLYKTRYYENDPYATYIALSTPPCTGTIPSTFTYNGTVEPTRYWDFALSAPESYDPNKDSVIKVICYYGEKSTGDVITGPDNTLSGLKIGDTDYTIPLDSFISDTAFAYTQDGKISAVNGSGFYVDGGTVTGNYVEHSETACAIGSNNTAEGPYSFAQGSTNKALGLQCFVQGYGNSAYTNSFAQGSNNYASNESIVQGQYCSAIAARSQAFGLGTVADGGMAIGSYNKTTTAAFVIGNGSNGSPSDLFLVNRNGVTSAADFKTKDGVTLSSLTGKVDKVAGKGLSTNDYTNAEQTKLSEYPNIPQTSSGYFLKDDGTWGIPEGGSDLPTSSADNSILAGSSDGTMSWQILGKSYYGGTITDETGDSVTDDNDESILDNNALELFDSFNGIGFAAQRAVADSEGNDIVSTYATKSEITQLQPLFYDAGSLTDSSAVNVYNNAIQELSSSQSALTLNVNCNAGEVPNFAIEISAGAAITLTLTKTVNNTVTTLYPSEAGGTSLESGKYYQITCVGNCWTMAAFTVPSV